MVASPPAFADSSAPEETEPTSSITSTQLLAFAMGHAGVATPLGELGIEVGAGYGPVRASVGLGLGLSGFHQMAAVRVISPPVPRFGPLQIGLGASVARGGFEPWVISQLPGYPVLTSDSLWANLELGGEVVHHTGFYMRGYIGVGHPFDAHCESDGEPCEPDDEVPSVVPFGGLAVGWAIGP